MKIRMMSFWLFLLLAITLLFLGGCASQKALTTVVEEAGKITTTFTGAAVQRDIVYMDRGKHRDSMQKDMYGKSGVVMEYELVKFSETYSAWLPKKITVRAPNTWMQKIALRPPDHRGWDTLDKGLGIVGHGVMGHFLNEILGTSNSAATPKYGGDYIWNPTNRCPVYC